MYRIKPLVDESAPKLNAYLKSIGKVPEKTTDYGPISTDKIDWVFFLVMDMD